MFCSKCGSKMEPSWRCCFSCGELNVNHEQNKSMINKSVNVESNEEALIIEKIDTIDEITNNNLFLEKENKKNIICLILNVIVLILLEIGVSFMKTKILTTLLIALLILYFYFFCFQKLLIKAGLPWWGAFVPIYNVYLMYILCLRDSTLFKVTIVLLILCFILTFIGMFFKLLFLIKFARVILIIFSILSEFISILMLWSLGKRFGRSGFITLLFGFVVIPTIAFSKKYQYQY